MASWDRAAAETGQHPTGSTAIMTHPGDGPIHALALRERWGRRNRYGEATVASYLGLIPTEHSAAAVGSGWGHIAKKGNPFVRGLLWEKAAQSAVAE